MTKPAFRTYPVQVRNLEPLTPNFVRVRFGGDDLGDLGYGGPDQRIKVILPLPGTGVSGFPTGADWYSAWRLLPAAERNPIRTYTLRAADPEARELVVDFVAHGDTGPASRWVANAAVGDEVLVIAPDATSTDPVAGYEWRPGAATTLLIAGDETAVPAAASIVESVPDGASGAVFLEVPTAADIQDLRVPAGISVTWLPRDGAGHIEHGALLGEAVRAWVATKTATDPVARAAGVTGADGAAEADLVPEVLWEAPASPEAPGLYAWIAGESGAVTRLRRYLVSELGVDRSRVAFMGYWRQGRAEN